MTKLTKAQRDELRRLHAEATPAPWHRDPLYWTMRQVEKSGADVAEGLPDDTNWPGRDDAGYICESHNALPALLDDLDAAEAERDEAVALIDAAKSDVRPESFLEHAQAILAKCIAPYSCEQMKAVGDALAACYRKGEKAIAERDALKVDQGEWRKGVALIASYLGEKNPTNLCCVRIARKALEVRAAAEKVTAERDATKAKLAELLKVAEQIVQGTYDDDSREDAIERMGAVVERVRA